MAISGTLNVNLSFLDSADETGVDTQKKITLSSADVYNNGKVAVISGTCDTAGVTINPLSPAYTAANGTAVSFQSIGLVKRIAFYANPSATLFSNAMNGFQLSSSRNVSSSALPEGTYALSGQELSAKTIGLFGEAPTAEYTVVLYGE